MKDFLRQQVDQKANELLKKSVVREYLQARVLQTIQDSGSFMDWAFLGGTALRFLYSIPRYSEDLDFSISDPAKDCQFAKVLQSITGAFQAEDYDITIKASEKKTVKSAFLKFSGLLYEMRISSHRDETLSIKLEIDTNPPPGAHTTTTIIRRFVTVNVNHYDQSSLLSGKIHAVLSRQYTKGRDLYDLVWYLSNNAWPEPNYELLSAALQQTGWEGPSVNRESLHDVLVDRMDHLKWERIQDDLQPFIERPQDLDLITRENCIDLIQRHRDRITI